MKILSEQAAVELPRTPVESTNIKSVGYDAESKTLVLEFHGTGALWAYPGVGPRLHKTMMASESKGGYFASKIKAVHPGHKVDVLAPAKDQVPLTDAPVYLALLKTKKAMGKNYGRVLYLLWVAFKHFFIDRNPEPEEVSQCEPFLRRQVQLLQPKIIVAMGRFAVQSLLGTTEAIGKLRGQRHMYAGVPVIVTYHPAYLLRSLPDKAKAWADLCLAREIANTQG